jgi:hypothetical protein
MRLVSGSKNLAFRTAAARSHFPTMKLFSAFYGKRLTNTILKYSKGQFYVRIEIVPVKEGSKSSWFENSS